MGAKSLGYYQKTDVSAARTLADIIGSAVPATCDYVVIQAETQPCRWRDDGTAPTASVGNLLAVGDSIIIRRAQFANFKIIQTTATALVNATFYKTG